MEMLERLVWPWRASASATTWSTLAIGYQRATKPATAALDDRWSTQSGPLKRLVGSWIQALNRSHRADLEENYTKPQNASQ
jgi:hypothetical protein